MKDFGPGILREMQERIFERFERTSFCTGLGLDLYILKQIIQAQPGSIPVKTEVMKGSQFTVKLPLDVNQQKMSVAG